MKCKNCGADVVGIRCEYCGTIHAKQINITHKQLALDLEIGTDGRFPRETPKELIGVTAIGDYGVRKFYEM